MSDAVCIICLDTDSRLYLLSECNLEEAYEKVTGLSLNNYVKLAPTLCIECAHRLTNCCRFIDKSLRAHSLLLELMKNHDLLTIQNIKTVNRVNNQLTSNLVKKVFEPDHCEFYFIDYKEDEKNVELVNSVHNIAEKVEVKFEKCEDNAVLVVPKEELINCIDNKRNLKHDSADYFSDDIDFNDDNVDLFDDEIGKKDEIPSDELGNFYNLELIKNKDDSDKIIDVIVDKKESINLILNKKDNVKKTDKKRIVPIKNRKKSNKKALTLFKVTDLNHEEQVAEMKQRQEFASYKRSAFKCNMCFTGFLTKTAHTRHMEKHTDKCGKFICDLCNTHVTSRHKIVKHLKRLHSMRYSCTKCVFVTRHRQVATVHERWHKGSKYKCSQCNEEFNTSSGRLTHIRIKHPSDFICILCGYSYIGKRGISHHMLLAHRFESTENPQGPECVPCNVRFASEAAYHQHIKVSPKHSGDGVRVRNTPPIRYSHIEQYVTCEQCGIQIKGVKMFLAHFRSVHPDKKLTKYVRAKVDKSCLCELCGKVVSNKYHLGYHMAAHAGQKLLQCDLCKKRFNYKPQLTLHMKTHSENRKMHECTVCKKNFTFKANRDRHMWIHKEKSFQCEVCDKTFATSSERRGHVLHVHMKKPWPKRNRGPRSKPTK